MADITDERLREIVDKTYCRLDEGEEIAAELLAARAEVQRLRSRLGWLDHLDTPEGRAMHATEAVRVENEQLRADLREAMELLRAHGQAPGWLLSVGKFEAVKDWNRRYAELLAKHKETP